MGDVDGCVGAALLSPSQEIRKAEAQGKIKAMHDKVKSDFEGSAFYKKSKRLANISRTGKTSKDVQI